MGGRGGHWGAGDCGVATSSTERRRGGNHGCQPGLVLLKGLHNNIHTLTLLHLIIAFVNKQICKPVPKRLQLGGLDHLGVSQVSVQSVTVALHSIKVGWLVLITGNIAQHICLFLFYFLN